MRTTIRLRGPADVIAALPYHLGYRPDDSLVVVCLDDGLIGLVARFDLPPPDVDLSPVLEQLLPVLDRERPGEAVLVSYECGDLDSDRMSRYVRDVLEASGVTVLARYVVRDRRWRCVDCDDERCPPNGLPVLEEEAVPAVAEYILLGRHPARSRSALGDRLLPVPDVEMDAHCAGLIRELEQARQVPSALRRRRQRALRHWSRVLVGEPAREGRPSMPPDGDEGWAWVVVSLLDTPLRDLLIAWLCPGTLDLAVLPRSLTALAARELPAQSRLPTGRRAARLDAMTVEGDLIERLAVVCRRSPPELAPGPLTVLGHVSWWTGDGAMARTAVDHALAIQPGYRLALLLERMIDHAVRPQRSA